jgi:hypothetical protein
MTKPNSALQAGGDETPVATDDFKGDTEHLILCIQALLDLDAKGALAPHGIGGHARTMLSAAAARLARPTPAAAAEVPPIELNIIRWWPDGFDERLERVWRDLVGFIPNYKLYDLQRMLAEFGFTMVLYEGPASPVAPAGVPTDLHQQIINLQGKDRDTVRHLYHDSVMTAYYAGHRDARHAAAELVCAVLSAGAPAVPLQDSSSVHLAADDGQAPSAGLTSQTASGNTAAPTKVDAPQERETVTLPRVASEAMLRAFYECPPDELTLAWQALVYVGERELRRAVQCDGRDGVTGSGASSEAAKPLASNEPNGNESSAAGMAQDAALTDEQIDRACTEWDVAILMGEGSIAARKAFRAALRAGSDGHGKDCA